MTDDAPLVRKLDDLDSNDVATVGGKNASLGEMLSRLGDQGIRIPGGFATTARAYRDFLAHNGLEEVIAREVERLTDENLPEVGEAIRSAITDGEIPEALARAVEEAYRDLGEDYGQDDPDVAVRSSATAEDLPEASFAGQLETFLNVSGLDPLLAACRRCFASLFTDRAMAYRERQGFGHLDVALSVGVQKMVRSDRSSAGVLFTLDTDTGFPRVVMINAAWGLGETVVQGSVNPDQYTVFKPLLDDPDLTPIIGKTKGDKAQKLVYADDGEESGATTVLEETSEEERATWVLADDEILRLARWGAAIEDHYGKPMDIEWARDGELDELFIVQARPETVHSAEASAPLTTHTLEEEGEVLLEGLAIGQGAAAGEVRVVQELSRADDFPEGAVLVTPMTDPDWVPLMKRTSAIVTDRGGRTSHAAIVSRELGVPAVVGSGDATERLRDGEAVTVSCQGEEGRVYRGELEIREEELDLSDVPEVKTRIMMNVASPAAAMRWWRLPCRGVGLTRLEHVINNEIRIHPLALTRFAQLEDGEVRERIRELTRGYDDPTEYFVDHLSRAVATVAAAQHPDPVLVRLSDFKTNEYARLVGGAPFEPEEDNPMLGWRGASRYYSDGYADGFALECRALRRVREEMGFRNVVVMVPFCRTPEEADRVLEVMAREGLERGRAGLEVYVMAEIPSNVLEAGAFAARFDGFSIGSNDLTQLVLGVGRDAERVAHLFDEGQPAVRGLIRTLVTLAHEHERPVGLCGQAPSDRPEFAGFLVEAGIDSISVNPDSVIQVLEHVARAEAST